MAAILTWHEIDDSGAVTSVAPRRFRAQLSWLARAGYEVAPLGRIVDRIAAGDPLPARLVALTFDDASRSVATVGLPELLRHGFPATVFVPTGDCGARRELPERLGPRELRELHAAGVALGAHSITHARLPALADRALEEEIHDSAAWLEDLTGAAVRHFAYPYGAYDERVRQRVAARFDGACGVELRALGAREDRHRLPRIDAYYLDGLIRAGGPESRTGSLWLGLRRRLRNARAAWTGEPEKAGRAERRR